MRQILFRGKRTNNGEWVIGFLVMCKYTRNDGGNLYYVTKPNIIPIGNIGEADYDGDGNYYEYEVIPETVGQYTGLKDKNGKRIFEGDIVKADDFIFAVKYGKCGGVANADNYGYMGFYLEPFSEATKLHSRYGLRNDICYFDNIEIINNIHNNPELLKGE